MARLPCGRSRISIRQAAEIYRMLKRAEFYRSRRIRRIVDHRVTDIAVVSNHFAAVAHVLAVMTTKTT